MQPSHAKQHQMMNKQYAESIFSKVKKRIYVLLLAILVYRIGSHIPIPGLDLAKINELFQRQQTGSVFDLLNLFSGGALSRLSIFALGIMPYITASIIMQLLGFLVPKLEQLRKEGESGRRRINQLTRYATMLIALVQGIAICKLITSQNVNLYYGFEFYFVTLMSLTCGTAFLMWIGEKITEFGFGNGISIIIFASIVSRVPSAIGSLFSQLKSGELEPFIFILLLISIVAVLYAVVTVERAQRRITVNHASYKTRVGYSYQSLSHLPIKLNTAGVIPPIFASSLLLLPATILSFTVGGAAGQSGGSRWLTFMNDLSLMFSPGTMAYVIAFSLLIFFFCYFYTSILFNPKDTAENLKRSNVYLNGIRPGEQTANYIKKVLDRLTFFGAVYLILISLLPELFSSILKMPFYFGGTSLLIVVVVVMDLMSQLSSEIQAQQFKSLMKSKKN